jgi:hypothetical protein
MQARRVGSDLDRYVQHKKRQRLAMPIEAETGIDAPFKDVVENENAASLGRS